MDTQGNPLFPVFLKLDKIQTLIVGGGNVGLEKLEALLKNDPYANIRIVAPQVKPEVKALAAPSPYIHITERKVKRADFKGIDIAILATDDRQLHIRLREYAKRKHILLNVADTPDLCDFYLGSTVKKGDLKIGISTNGKSPTFAKRFRQILEDVLPDDTQSLLNNLKGIRDKLQGGFQQKVKELNKITESLVEK
ncbi:MAG: bifunctional precorrin-2 dehydrogenase/sirohydrochlorin ferrochelatase [Cyclobacteriaceae bacterium]|nr:bifunctional precorrin-2 dehydrogenase/sirohydrochlorin ferrochelatase [Cyclobacteriaceae bacterium HetDA_MAG_MS6]